MIVSWNWLKDYVAPTQSHEEVSHRLAMSGLNHEGTTQIGDDFAVDLEVTSNRPDCLGHIGVAREIAVLFDLPLKIKDPQPPESDRSAAESVKVSIECPDLCTKYTARIIRGVKVGPSPDWLVRRLQTLFDRPNKEFKPINNVVDITNYVLMECGQPLHAFDLARLAGPEIIVRRAAKGEEFKAIDHNVYELDESMCVIGDANTAVALGGVMGGADTEVSDTTVDLLIESADFSPSSIRDTARKLKLHSDSSFRFERGVDHEGVAWSSRRCCELILDIAGGELEQGVVVAGQSPSPRQPVTLRLSQLKRILGIEIGAEEVRKILSALGNEIREADDRAIEVIPPTWRRDIAREIDLVEEAARIHGYDEIPEDVAVPMAASHRTDHDRSVEKIRQCVTSFGFDEAMTSSMAPEEWTKAFNPYADLPALTANTAMLKGADRLRVSLLPSLLAARQVNESLSNDEAELFEIARIYLPKAEGLPQEHWALGLASGKDFFEVKGVVESILDVLGADVEFGTAPLQTEIFDRRKSCLLTIDGQTAGLLGEVGPQGEEMFKLRSPATVCELFITPVISHAVLVPQQQTVSAFPPITRDINFILDESVRWADLADSVRKVGGEYLKGIEYRETYRDENRDGRGKKRLLFSIMLRSPDRTLTGDEADEIHRRICTACERDLNAVLVS